MVVEKWSLKVLLQRLHALASILHGNRSRRRRGSSQKPQNCGDRERMSIDKTLTIAVK